jgi:hypothetical protein
MHPVSSSRLRHRRVFSALVISAAVAFSGYAVWPREPLYQEKPLSYWLDRLPGYHDNLGWGAT